MNKIYLTNTLGNKKELFKPIKPKQVGFYSCGPTVYDYPHIGNMRAYIFNDLLKRVWQYNGYKVKHIMNITDVGHLTSDADTGEDKMEEAKQREGKSAWDIAKFYTKVFKDYSNKLNILKPTKYVTATSQVKEQIKFVKLLEGKGYLYQTSDGLYFDTGKLKDYGKLTGQNLSNLKAGARIKLSKEKKNLTDFAVWKFSPTNKQRDMEWDSPWGKGFPGWHLECSVISTKYLGQPFDIHTGGIEHIPIHHTNEIAQSEAAYKKPLANYWIHFEHLIMRTSKMSKSAGESVTIDKLIAKGYNPLAYRYFILPTHYRKRQEFSWQALSAAQTAGNKMQEQIAGIKGKGVVNNQYKNKFTEAVNNDLNIPKALALAWDLLKDNNVSDQDKKTTILDFDKVFGLRLKEAKPIRVPAEIKQLADKRWQARLNKNWKEADILRQQVEAKGYVIEDGSDNYTILKK